MSEGLTLDNSFCAFVIFRKGFNYRTENFAVKINMALHSLQYQLVAYLVFTIEMVKLV